MEKFIDSFTKIFAEELERELLWNVPLNIVQSIPLMEDEEDGNPEEVDLYRAIKRTLGRYNKSILKV